MSDTYEAYALKYGSAHVSKAAKYYRYEAYEESDEQIGIDFYFWLLRNEDRIVLVDCGFDDVRAPLRGYAHEVAPLDLLARFGVSAADVDHVVLSHMHFDHIGNIGLFPNATFTVARAELEFWTGEYSDRAFLSHSGEPEETAMVVELERQGRVRLVDGREEIFPGITVTPVRGHTPGQLVTQVATAAGNVVIASDAIHFYDEMEKDRPYWVFHDLEGMYRGFQLLRELEAEPTSHVVAGHDPAVMTRFKAVDDRCVDLTVPIG